jgi:spore germination cell wall hydrolase CwlJ-like protein
MVNPGLPAALADLVTSDKADILATAYAPSQPDYAKASPFASLLLDEPNDGRFIPPVAKGDHGWMSKPLPESVFSSAEQKCLAVGIYFEARGENTRGQAAVAQVILNRVRNPTYPNTICGVVYQNDHWRNACQFSFACDGKKDVITSPHHYKMAKDIALAVTAGKIFIADVGSSTHYHATYVHPRWSRTMEKMKKIGLHIFYRTHGGGWS